MQVNLEQVGGSWAKISIFPHTGNTHEWGAKFEGLGECSSNTSLTVDCKLVAHRRWNLTLIIFEYIFFYKAFSSLTGAWVEESVTPVLF